MKTLGFIGTGGMGSGMAANLIKAGHRLVVNDLRREATRSLENQGAEYRPSPKTVAEASEMVFSMLPYNEAVLEVGLGKEGLHEAAGGARLWIDFSDKGWKLLDGSAGGVEEQAAAGALTLWLSGPNEIFDRHVKIFQAMGKEIVYVGELGNAKLVKNAMAMVGAIQHMGLAEIFNWLEKGGVPRETFHEAMTHSLNRSEAVERICRALVSRNFKPRKSWMPKDVGFGLDLAKQMEVPMPFTALAYQLFSIAQATGLDGFEASGIAYHVYSLISGKK
jgi:3-hydroxyisobutyrate dehydrogenase-like beta-hydroxyacid dehydrogenase